MCSDTVFSNVVHFPGTDLYLKRNTRTTDNRSVKRAVHIGLRRGNIILEATGYRVEHFMDNAKHGITLQLGIYDDTHGVKVIDLVKALSLRKHLFIDAVNRLDSTLQRVRDMILLQLSTNRLAYAFDKIQALPILLLNAVSYFLITNGIEVTNAKIFQLLLDLLHTKTVCQGCIHLHGLQCGNTTLVVRLDLQGAHIMQSIAQLNENDANVLVHGKQHFAQVFDMRLFLVLDLERHDLGKTVNELCYILAEQLFDLLEVGLISAILNRVMQKGGADGIRVKL